MRIATLALPLALALGAPVLAQIVSTDLAFPKGATSTTVNGVIAGEQTRDYVVRARAGQTLKVTLGGSSIVYFNVLPPGSTGEAIFIGSSEGNSFSGTLSTTGAYRIRVYQMRASARRGERGNFRLTVAVTGGAAVAGKPVPIRGPGSLEERCKARVAAEGMRVVGVNRIEESQAAIEIYINVQGGQAPWKCTAYRNGTIGGIMYTGSEGAM